MEKKKLSMAEILAYSFGLFGLHSIIGYFNSYQAQFYNKTMAADIAIIGVIMLVAKLISSFADPFIGNFIDKSNFKSGKLRPFILISIIPFCILSIIIFIVVPFRGVALYIYIFITFLLWSIAMTIADIPSQGMLSMITPDPVDRNKLAGVSNFLKSVGLSACFVFVPVVCFFTGSQDINAKEYLITTLVMVILGCGLFTLIFFRNKERVPYQQNHTNIKEMFKMLKGNKPLMLILISALLGFGRNMAMGIQAQAAHSLIGTLEIFGMTIGGENTIILLGATSAISASISMAIAPAITKKLGERTTFLLFSVYGLIVAIIAFIIFITGTTSLLSLLICLFFVGIMYGTHTFLPTVMVADCVDYYELQTGKRTEGTHFSILSFSIKVSNALSVAGGLIIVGLSGYDANDSVFSAATKNIIYMAYVLIPGVCCMLSAIPIFFYKLYGKEKQRITEELRLRHSQAEIEKL